MSGAFSIPFALLAFFYPQRLAFAALAYLSLWVLVIGQLKRIAELQKRLELPNVTLGVGRDLIDIANDFDAPGIAHWVRGRIGIPVIAESNDAVSNCSTLKVKMFPRK